MRDQPFILVHSADLRPESGQCPDQVAVNGTVIRPNDEQDWLYASVDFETNELLHTKREPTTTKGLGHSFLMELSEKYDVFDAVFPVDGSHSLRNARQRHGFDFQTRNTK